MISYDFVNQTDKIQFTAENNKRYFSKQKLTVQEFTDSIVIPNDSLYGGVYCNNKFIYNTSLHRTWAKTFPEIVKADNYIEEDVVYIGMFHDVWGHCLTDNIKHLWFLFDEKFLHLKNLKYVFTTVNSSFQFSPNFSSLLKKLDVDVKKLIKIDAPVKFKKIYIPDECFFYNDKIKNYQYSSEYKNLISIISNNTPPLNTNYEKVYYSRTGIKDKKDIGEHNIEVFFSKRGFKILKPEQLSLDVKNCKYFASTEGSISHNIIFCRADANITILRKAKHAINGYQSLIDRINNQNITYIDCSMSVLNNKKSPWCGPFFIYVSKKLSDFYHVKKEPFPLIIFLGYICYHLPRIIYRALKNFLKGN